MKTYYDEVCTERLYSPPDGGIEIDPKAFEEYILHDSSTDESENDEEEEN